MITHVATFRWKPDITADDIERLKEALGTLPALLPQISTYRFGSDLGLTGGNVDFAVVATFDSTEDWRIYDEAPSHERVRATFIRPWIAERSAVQLES